MLLRHRSLVLLFFAGVLGLSPCARAAKKPPAVTGEFGSLVQLSPFEVSAESMEFNRWIKISSPHFVVYTDTSAKEGTVLVRHMEMVHQAAQFFFRRKSLSLPPILIVLPTGRSDWRKIGSKGGVEWEVATSLVGSTRKLILAQYDWQEGDLGSVWAMIGMREVRAMNLGGPFWYERGIMSFFKTVTFSRDTLTIGKQGFDALWIKAYGWMNWPKFFNVTSRSPEFTKDSTDHIQWEGQCAMFVHYLLTNGDPASTPRLLSWAAYLQADNEPTEESFKKIFSVDWKTWQDKLDTLLHGGTYTTGHIRFPPAALDFPIATIDVSPREMRELFVLAQILNQNTKDSDLSLDGLLQRGLKTNALRELLADACDRRGRPDAYLHELREIIAAGSSNPAVFSQAATELFSRKAATWTLDTRLGDEVGEIRGWCHKALELEPLYLEANETLAWTEALAPVVDKHSLETITRICRTLDGNAPTDNALTALAIARWRSGGIKQARSLCERLDASSLTAKSMKILVKELMTRLDAVPAASAPQVPTEGSGAKQGGASQ